MAFIGKFCAAPVFIKNEQSVDIALKIQDISGHFQNTLRLGASTYCCLFIVSK